MATDEIISNLYRIEVPLPDSPLKAINSYVVKGPDTSLVIDTGMRRPECESVLRAGLDELDVDLSRTDFFITHLHADHMGLVGELASASSKVYFNRPDGELLETARQDPQRFIDKVITHAKRGGFPERRRTTGRGWSRLWDPPSARSRCRWVDGQTLRSRRARGWCRRRRSPGNVQT